MKSVFLVRELGYNEGDDVFYVAGNIEHAENVRAKLQEIRGEKFIVEEWPINGVNDTFYLSEEVEEWIK